MEVLGWWKMGGNLFKNRQAIIVQIIKGEMYDKRF